MTSPSRIEDAIAFGRLAKQLRLDVDGLGKRFLAKWIPASPEHMPSEYEHDLKAYCVLSHAAMEDYAEQLSMAGMQTIRTDASIGRTSRGLVSLYASYGFAISPVDDDNKSQLRLADLLRVGLEEAVRRHGNTVEDNHGFSAKYLRKLLLPIGVDLPEDARLLTALATLSEARGSFAHRSAKQAMFGKIKRAQKHLSPEDAAAAVADCMDLCDELSRRAMASVIRHDDGRKATHRAPSRYYVSATWATENDPDPLWHNL